MIVTDIEDDKSSVYSHPSLLDGAINVVPLQLNFPSILFCTPESNNFFDNNCFSEEQSSQVRKIFKFFIALFYF